MSESIQARQAALARIAELHGDPRLTTRYWAGVATGDLRSRRPEDLHGGMAGHLQLARDRAPQQARVRVFTPDLARDGWAGPNSLLQVVTDDMPFLVDSCTMAVRRCGLAVELVVHPVLPVERTPEGLAVTVGDGGSPESFLHIEFERTADPAVLAAVDREVRVALRDVRAASADGPAMRQRASDVAEAVRLDKGTESETGDEAAEVAGLIEWMAEDRFTFLGAADYVFGPDRGSLEMRTSSALGVLRVDPASLGTAPLLDSGSRFVLTKSDREATVRRFAPMDVLATPLRDDAGRVEGERRMVGLFAAEAYLSSPSTIPLLRRKVADVIDMSGLDSQGHAGRELRAILEGYPRDELFAASTGELHATAMGILHLQERRRVRLFARRDRHRPVWSCLVFLPRDRYTTDVRRRVLRVLLEAFGGYQAGYTTALTESSLARLHFIVRLPAGTTGPEVDLAVVEERVAEAVRSWSDELRLALVAHVGDVAGRALHARYAEAFPPSYTAEVAPRAAIADVMQLEELRSSGEIALRFHRHEAAAPDERTRLTICVSGGALALADLLPVLGNLGIRVLDERPAELHFDEVAPDATHAGGPPRPSGPGRRATLHDLGVEHTAGPSVDLADPVVTGRFADAFRAVWGGRASDDGFNRLVLGAGLEWREVAVLRAYARYLRQLGFTYSQGYVESALAEHPDMAARLVALFRLRFDPEATGDPESTGDPETTGETATRRPRAQAEAAMAVEIEAGLVAVASPDHDRILRTYLELIGATLRTNAYQRDADGSTRPALALKLAPSRIALAPKPRPRFEVFVTSPRVEGTHLRMAPVARGGIRWSDRPEDFRTEVLGLMKAQEVKNAVIVPSGAKGGFVVRRPPPTRDGLLDEAVECYRIYIGSLLDVTDNRVRGAVVAPPLTIRHDEDDPYLVVAADKGTAAFSDIANQISVARGFWLGDAFASGGSAGYDHKRMGITARGAWESVTCHFLRLGVDITRPAGPPITVVGIGDMSGDVFGNGMLLSDRLCLVAAFDHRHVFLDPDPDPAASFRERARLFGLPRSSWADYDPTVLSEGGAVIDRSAKRVEVSPQVRRRLALAEEATELTPAQLITAILRAPVDLLWNGGIGTYVKASTESHGDVGDRANDGLRIDAADLRCRVIGEGGNLGLTQRARVEFAALGGLLNTDAIDNSAGVDTSDHEVNLKILLDQAQADGEITRKQRDGLLASVTEEIAALVLADNTAQNRVLVSAVTAAPRMAELHERYIAHLEETGHLDRRLEALPDAEELQRRRADGRGLVVPELAVLLAYTKMVLVESVLRSPGRDLLDTHLRAYFPQAVRDRFPDAIAAHPLHAEIAATVAVNELVNHNGITYAFRMAEETGATPFDVVHAHIAAMRIGEVADYWRTCCELDGQVASETQVELLEEADRLTERLSRWILRNQPRPFGMEGVVGAYRAGVREVDEVLRGLVSGVDSASIETRRRGWEAAGVPAELAARAARLELLPAAMDITRIAQGGAGSVPEVGEVYFALDDQLALSELRSRIIGLPRQDRWQAMARAALRDDLDQQHASLTRSVLTGTPRSPAGTRVDAWIDANRDAVLAHLRLAAEAATASAPELATLSVVLRELRPLAGSV